LLLVINLTYLADLSDVSVLLKSISGPKFWLKKSNNSYYEYVYEYTGGSNQFILSLLNYIFESWFSYDQSLVFIHA
jgi:hypothetical protein